MLEPKSSALPLGYFPIWSLWKDSNLRFLRPKRSGLTCLSHTELWCPRQDLNLYGFLHQILSLACLPVPPRRQIYFLAGPTGLEPATSWATTKCSNRLNYGPILVGRNGIEPLTRRFSVCCSNQLSYLPIIGSPTENWTPISWLKTRCPKPLDDRAILVVAVGLEPTSQSGRFTVCYQKFRKTYIFD